MSDTMNCPGCGHQLPATAAFCTNCGTRLGDVPAAAPGPDPTSAPPAAPPPAAPPADATRVDTPGLHDATQVFAAPPPPAGSPAPPAPPVPPPPAAPWQPAPADAPAPPAAAAPPAWTPPAAQAPPVAPPPPTSGWAAPPAAPMAAPPVAPAWNAPGAAPVAVAPPKPKGGSPIGGLLALVGGVLTIAGVFSPWVTNNQTDAALSGWDLVSGDKGFKVAANSFLAFESADPYALVALGAVAVVLGVLLFTGAARTVVRLAAIVVGLAIIGLLVRDWTSLADVVTKNAPPEFEISSALGFYLAAAGGVLTALAALLPARTRSAEI